MFCAAFGRAALIVVIFAGSLAGIEAAAGAAWARPVIAPSDVERMPNASGLLASLRMDEGQLDGLVAYRTASSYVRRARSGASAAGRTARAAGAALRLAQGRLYRAVRANDAARARVSRYKLALYELAMAEYTGMVNLPSGIDFASLQVRLERGEITDVARADAVLSLGGARKHLRLTQALLGQAKKVVKLALAADLRAQRRLKVARAELAVSVRALTVARRWATVPGACPPRPEQRLSALEGGVARPPGRPRLLAQALPMPVRAMSASPAALQSRRQVTEAPLTAGPARGVAREKGPSITGPSFLSASEIEGWYASTGSRPDATVAFPQLVSDYFFASRKTGVRADLAFAQSIVETSYFSFPAGGQVVPRDNNFAGIGACGSCSRGWSFPSALAGVLGQEELLLAYASPNPSAGFSWVSDLGVQGCCSTWLALSGIWASNLSYGYEILSVYRQMVDWVLRRELLADGLATAPAVPVGLELEKG